MTNHHHQLSISHGSIVVEEAGRGELPVLLIHGNSLSREVFRKQLGGALSRKYRLVAFDLPGHGDSSDALNASRTYTRPGHGGHRARRKDHPPTEYDLTFPA